MSSEWAARVFRADAVFDAVVGVLLLSATWDGLYAALDLPHATPELLVQLAGVLLVGFAYLLWFAPEGRELGRRVAVAAALANGASVVVLVVWLVNGELGIGTLGKTLLALVAAALALFAVLEALIAVRTPARERV